MAEDAAAAHKDTAGRRSRPAGRRRRAAFRWPFQDFFRLPADLMVGRLFYQLKRPLHRTPLYRWSLGQAAASRAGAHLVASPSDPWPGDAQRGAGIVRGEFVLPGGTVSDPAPLWNPLGVNPAWVRELHSFSWLGDLRALGGDQGRRAARELVDSWIERHRTVAGIAWEPAVVGRRLAHWLGQYEFYAASADAALQARLIDSAARQARYLERNLPAGLAGAELLSAVRGLTTAGICLPRGQRYLDKALGFLVRELPKQILADGVHVARSPSVQLRVLRDLIDIRANLSASGREPPADLALAIERMAPALRMFQVGDGGLVLFNGGWEETGVRIDMALTRADGRGRSLMSAPQSGFQRLQAGRTVILADCGQPPAPGYDHTAQAGTLSFELSVGKERLVVNCGAVPPGDDLHAALASTAAHSTLVVAETNSAQVLRDGGLGHRPENVTCRREQVEGSVLLELSHDGYARRYGLIHERRLYLSAAGDDLRGEDRVTAAPDARPDGPLPVAVRFHLHPDVQAGLVQDGGAALLRLPSGEGWRLHAGGEPDPPVISIEDSIYQGQPDDLRRTQQVVLTAAASAEGATIKWAFKRAPKRR